MVSPSLVSNPSTGEKGECVNGRRSCKELRRGPLERRGKGLSSVVQVDKGTGKSGLDFYQQRSCRDARRGASGWRSCRKNTNTEDVSIAAAQNE